MALLCRCKNMMRIGIFGGTFDPLHNGHLNTIGYALDRADLDHIRVIVAGDPYQKEKPGASAQTRLNWVREALEDHYAHRKEVIVDDREIKRDGPTYTIDTILELKNEYPDSDFVLIVGDDVPETLSTWKDADKLVRSVELFVVPRSIIQVSSTQIRSLLSENMPVSGLLPAKIEREIYEKALYNTNHQGKE